MAEDTVDAVMHRVTMLVVGFSLALAVVAGAIGWFASGKEGLFGALIAAAVTAFFCGSTAVIVKYGSRRSSQMTSILLLGGWLVKMIILVLVFELLGVNDVINKTAFGLTIMVGILGSLAIDVVVVFSSRVPTIENGRSDPPVSG